MAFSSSLPRYINLRPLDAAVVAFRLGGLVLAAILGANPTRGLAQPQTFPSAALYSGVYFGTGEDGEGRWAMCVYWLGTPTFEFVGRARDDAPQIRSYLYTSEVFHNGDFSDDLRPRTDGKIALGRVTGSSGSWRFVGEVDRGDSPSAIFAGYWRSVLVTRYPFVEAIVGPSGKALVVYRTSPTTGEDALTRIDAHGRFLVALNEGTRVSGRIDLGDRRLVVEVGTETLPPIPGDEGRLSNFSVLPAITAPRDRVIQQFSISGEKDKNLLLRAVGAPLAALGGAASYLADPAFDVWNHDSGKVAGNDDWASTDSILLGAMQRVGAFPLPADSRDAAQVAAFPPGIYTVVTKSSAAGETGVVLTEGFDLGSADSQIARVTSRGRVGAGDALIAGFTVTGDRPAPVLVRALGPRLVDFGVADALADPRLEIVSSTGVSVTLNDDWSPLDATLVSAMRRAGGIYLRRPGKDAAVLVTLPPGAYLVSVKGADRSGGVAQIEVAQPQLARGNDAALAVELFRVTVAREDGRYAYHPQLLVYGTEAAAPVVVTSVRFGFVDGTGGRIPEWRKSQPVGSGIVVDLIPPLYGEPSFTIDSSAEATHIAVTITFRGPDEVERAVTALAQVTPRP